MKADAVYLEHIHAAILKIETIASSGHEAFLTDFTLHDAAIRNFEIIGEAAKQLTKEIKARQPQIPWREVAGFRDILIHQYFGVDLDEVWRIIQNELPGLREAVEKLQN